MNRKFHLLFSDIYKIALIIIILYGLYKSLYIGKVFVYESLYLYNIQCSILVLLNTFLLWLIPSLKHKRRLLEGAILVVVIINFGVYNFYVSDYNKVYDVLNYTNQQIIINIISPIGFVIDYLFFTVHNTLKWKDVFILSIYPIVFGFFLILIKSINGLEIIIYDLDVSKLIWIIILILIIFTISFIVILTDKLLPENNFRKITHLELLP